MKGGGIKINVADAEYTEWRQTYYWKEDMLDIPTKISIPDRLELRQETCTTRATVAE
jgi:hypothetical protein